MAAMAHARSAASRDHSDSPVRVSARPNATLGNQAYLRRLFRTPVAPQAKLTVGSVNDPLEHEADAAADQVMRMADPALALTHAPPTLSRKCAACEKDEEHPLQRDAVAPAQTPDFAPPIVHDVLRSSGRPLDPDTHDFMAARFGSDFSDVRIHTDAEDARSAREVGARAYTVGRDIVFDQGQFSTHTQSGRRLLAHELAHVVQQDAGDGGVLRRDPPTGGGGATKKAAPAAPTPCTFNCLDTTFLQMNDGARATALATQCPDGFPSAQGTFFGQTIPAATGKLLRKKLLEAQSLAKREYCIQGRDPETAFVLDRAITTYPGHSGGIDKSVDIDVQGQPFLMHENSKDAGKAAGERDIDKETGPVFDRIAFWSHFRKSVIPGGISSVARVPKGSNTDRAWRDPTTGAAGTATTTGEIYDRLAEESSGMQGYFNLLTKTDAELGTEIFAFNAVNTDGSVDLAKLKIPTERSDDAVKAFRAQIANDYLVLGGSKAQLAALAGPDIAKAAKAPPGHLGDRPFQGGAVAGATLPGGGADPAANRRPELGFLSLPGEVVVALTSVGLRWGAIDFGGESGDVMHFDCNNLPGC